MNVCEGCTQRTDGCMKQCTKKITNDLTNWIQNDKLRKAKAKHRKMESDFFAVQMRRARRKINDREK